MKTIQQVIKEKMMFVKNDVQTKSFGQEDPIKQTHQIEF